MTRDQLNASIAAILTTLDETDGGPESMIYLALGTNMKDWETVKSVLTHNKLTTSTNHYMQLTEKGKTLARELNAIMQKTA